LLLRTLAVAVVLLSCVTAAELVLRFGAPLPSQERLRLRQDLPGLTPEIVYERNAFGLRALSMRTRDKPPGVVRVFCLGASTTDQPTQSTEDTWCGLLERRLAPELAARGLRLETAAFGRGGMRAADLLSWARDELPAYEPDLVVTLLGINDLSWNGGADYRYEGRLDLPSVAAAPGPKPRCQLFSELCRRLALARERLAHWRDLRAGRAVEWHSRNLEALRREHAARPFSEQLERDPDPIREFSDASAALISLLRERSVEVVVLGQPVLWKPELSAEEEAALWFPVETPEGPVRPSGAWLAAEMARYNAMQRRHAEALGAAYLDLDRRIPKDLDHFFDDCHFTDRASELVAEQLLPVVRARLRPGGPS
jgi:lysophospholipase L1-like esterase